MSSGIFISVTRDDEMRLIPIETATTDERLTAMKGKDNMWLSSCVDILCKAMPPKGVLEFNLPEQKSEFKRASQALDWYLLVWNIHQEIEKKLKWGEDFFKENSSKEVADWVMDLIIDGCNIRNLNLFDE